MNQSSTKHRICIFASGAGSNAKQIITHFFDHKSISIELIVCNNPNAGVIDIAKQFNIPILLIERKKFETSGYVAELSSYNINFIVLAGFLWKIPKSITENYQNAIVNIHPALLPKYGGKGMYGQHVHQSVIGDGEKESGITIHWVDDEYDHGNIIFQAKCPVMDNDTSESLGNRIHQLEHAHYADVIENILLKKQND